MNTVDVQGATRHGSSVTYFYSKNNENDVHLEDPSTMSLSHGGGFGRYSVDFQYSESAMPSRHNAQGTGTPSSVDFKLTTMHDHSATPMSFAPSSTQQTDGR